MEPRGRTRSEVAGKLREIDGKLAEGKALSDVLRSFDVSESAYQHWRETEALGHSRRVAMTVTGVAVLVAAAHAAFPDVKIDVVVVALLAIAAVPWLGEILESFDLPGGGSVKYRDLRRRIREAENAATQADHKAREAIDWTDNLADGVEDAEGAFARSAETVTTPPAAEAAVEAGTESSPSDELNALITRYNDVRETQRSGSIRTATMTGIVRDMIRVAGRLATFDWEENLRSKDRGRRLAAYAYLFQDSRCEATEPLLHSLLEIEDKPFGQYWALKALRNVVAKCDDSSIREIEPRIVAAKGRFREGSDRGREIRELLHEIAHRDDAAKT